MKRALLLTLILCGLAAPAQASWKVPYPYSECVALSRTHVRCILHSPHGIMVIHGYGPHVFTDGKRCEVRWTQAACGVAVWVHGAEWKTAWAARPT